MKMSIGISLYLIAAYLFYGTQAATGTDPAVSLNMVCHKALSTVVCTFEFTNNGQEDVHILKRNTPLEGLLSPFITVTTSQGYPLQYKGPYMYYVVSPTKEDFTILKAGKTISATVDITKAFYIERDGLYTIQYTKPLEYLTEVKMASNGDFITHKMNIGGHLQLSLFIQDTYLLFRPTIEEVEEGEKENGGDIVNIEACGRIRFIEGTQSQRAKTAQAHERLCMRIPRVANNVQNDHLYRIWFGPYAYSNKVKRVLQSCSRGITNDLLTYHMNGPGCKPRVGAYTYDGSRTAFLCPILHTFPPTCPNSNNAYNNQEATLIHEWSHAYGYTDDCIYGSVGAQQLARFDPQKAINNAENYNRYYCPASYR